MQDMRAQDKLTEPLMGSTPDYSWNNKLATCYETKRTGDKFLPLPHGYIPSPGEVLRGGAYPFSRDYTPGNAPGSILETPIPKDFGSSFREQNERDYRESRRYMNKPGK